MIDAGAMSSNSASLGGSFIGGLIVFVPVEKNLYLDCTGQDADYLIFFVAELTFQEENRALFRRPYFHDFDRYFLDECVHA